jgi:hypothetical protein
MKAISFLSLGLVAMLTGCVAIPVDSGYGGGGGYTHDYDRHDHYDRYQVSSSEAYSRGRDRGESDSRRGASKDPYRYRNEVPSHRWSSFVDGYQNGYRPAYVRPTPDYDRDNDAREEGPQTYNNGYRRGRSDAEHKRGFNPARERGALRGKYVQIYNEAYEKGYKDGIRRR